MTSPEASTEAASSSAKNALPAAERLDRAEGTGRSGRAAARCATAVTAARSMGPSATSTAAPRSRRLERTSAAALGAAHRAFPLPQQALARSTARQVVRERCRGLVGGVQIVDGSTTPRSAVAFSSSWATAEKMRWRSTGPPTPPPAAHRGEQPGKRGLRVVGERAGQLRAPRRQRLERLHERRVRRAALLLVGGAAERVETELLRLSEHGLDEAGLADPERARDEQRAAIGGSGTPQRGGRRSELALTPFDGGVKEPDRPHRRATRELALERERRLGGLRAEPRELVSQHAELPRRGRRSPLATVGA